MSTKFFSKCLEISKKSNIKKNHLIFQRIIFKTFSDSEILDYCSQWITFGLICTFTPNTFTQQAGLFIELHF